MRLQRIWAHAAAALAIASVAGCTGQIGESTDETGGSPGSGVGGGHAGGPATTGTAGSNPGPGTGGSNPTGVGGGGGTGTAHPLDLKGSPQYYRMIRLTNAQWARAVQDVLKLASPSGLEQNFQDAVTGTTDFSNNELVLDVNQRSWADFQTAAETLATQVTASDTALAKVYSGTDAAGFITALGRRAYRRPLTTAEQSTYMTLYSKGSTLTGTRSAFAKGASLVIRAMLQSPYFLFRTELGAVNAPLNGYEMAAKLSLWLRGTTPNDALLDSAAGPGKLDTADGAAALATTMLAETTANTVMRQFHGELYHFERFMLLSKVNTPTYKESLNAELQEASYRFFERIFSQGLGVKDMLTSTTGYISTGLAPLYGVTAPSSGYVERDLGVKRVGYFSQIPFLALNGKNGDADPIHRGVAMNLDVLCAELGPPAIALPEIPPLEPGQTNRQRIDKLTSGCGQSCHNEMINPLGFAFENFDGMGQWRDTENGGLTIDSSGSYTFADGTTRNWTAAADLMQGLATSPQTHTCYAKKLASYALQRDIIAKDTPMLSALTSTSMGTGGSVKQLVVDLVKNAAFRTHIGGTP
jgi:hypothetical protein